MANLLRDGVPKKQNAALPIVLKKLADAADLK